MSGPDAAAGTDIDGQVVVLTGATSGVGRAAALDLADRGATVAAIGRNEERGRAVADEAADAPGEVRFHRADLASQDRVGDLAAELRASYDRLDVLAHNAGLSVSERTESPDGIELTFAVNHLAPYLLTHELLDRLREGAPSRVVVTASGIHYRGDLDFDDLGYEETGYGAFDAYARSKLANVAFTIELAERLRGTDVVANCFHPGFVPGSGLWRDVPAWMSAALRLADLVPGVGSTEADGGERLVALATDPQWGERTGCYVSGDSEKAPADEAGDPGVRRRLWRVSAVMTGVDPEWPDLE